MVRIRIGLPVAAAVMFSVLAFPVWAEETARMTTKDLPAQVLSAFQKAYPKAVIERVGLEKKGDLTYVELETKDGKVNRDLLYTADGILYETEEEMAIEDLPTAVKSSVSAAYPKGKIAEAVRLWRGTPAGFELEIKDGESSFELQVSADGKIQSTAEKGSGGKSGEDEEEDEDDDEKGD